jgi:hypothetical protein
MRRSGGAASAVLLLTAYAAGPGNLPQPGNLLLPQRIQDKQTQGGGAIQSPDIHHPDSPDAASPLPKNPGAGPETKGPETKGPETKGPETKSPETKSPENPGQSNPDQPHPNGPAPGDLKLTVTVFDRLEVQSILGKEVRSGANENMGRIIDVIVDRSGQVRAAIIDFGGFLGVGNRKVAVAWNALRFPPDPHDPTKVDRIGLDLTREQVQAAPEYKEDKPVVVLGASGGLESLPFP